MSEINLIDVTLRDGHQSLWSTRMTNAMIAPWLSSLDRVGFHTIDIVGGAVFDVCVRYLLENPWQRMRMITERVRKTPANVWLRGQSLFTFELFSDDVVTESVRHIAACGVRNITTYDALNDIRNVETTVKAGHGAGLGVTGAIAYTLSPVHTDEYYRARAKELLALKVNRLCIKDPSGLLTPERIKTLAPVILAAAGAVPVELHSHCLSSLAPQVYSDALDLGIKFFHAAVTPLANGASLPPAENFVRQARARGHTLAVDEASLKEMADYFTWVAVAEDKPLGRVLDYDPALYQHQVPGGMISNLKAQLASAKLEHRLDEVLDEVSRVREDLGYPIMVSPFAQFLITQATLNVVQGERYRTIPDELRKYALGYYGRPAAPMAPDFFDRATGGAEPVTQRPADYLEPTLPRLRNARGPFRDNDHLLLAAYYDDELIDPLLPARDIARSLRFVTSPLLELLDYVARDKQIRHARVKVGDLELVTETAIS
jgi:oxaloacetate decarboxylase (Na+ extruding) subunit alpha